MISILTTVYNGYEFLGECAKSITTQKDQYGEIRFSWEWWIGINGHGEGGDALRMARAVGKLDPRIHVVNLPVRGRVASLNALKSMANGNWIAILDCDDIWEPDKLITQMIALQMSPKPIDVIGTHCSYFGEYSGSPTLPSGWIGSEEIRAGNPFINSSILIRSDLASWEDRYGLEDYDLFIRLSRLGKSMFNIPHSLVRHRIHGKSAFNGKGGQDLEGLKSYYGLEERPTVVTAYYPIRSKYPVEEYMKWILQFWPRISCCLVFYTDPGLVSLFESAFQNRKFTRVIGIPFSELRAFNKLSADVWATTHSLDSEVGHTPELYAMWYEKKEFVLRAIELNPFHSTKFVWCDAGILRYPEWIPHLSSFPMGQRIPSEKMLLLEIDPFKEEDSSPDENGIRGRFDTRSTLGGGILASDIGGWNQWSKAYDAMLMRYYLAGRFIGKDQNIFASMILEKLDLALLVKRPMEFGPIAGWFYLLFFLSERKIV